MADSSFHVVGTLDENALAHKISILYGIKDFTLLKLNSYDDQTYHIKIKGQLGYIFKISNPIDAAIEGLLDAQISLTEHVLKKGTVDVPRTIPRLDGGLVDWEDLTESNGNIVRAPVRMTTFNSGVLMRRCKRDSSFLFDLGQTLAKLHLSMQDFHRPVFDVYKTHWSMERFMESADKVDLLKDPQERQLAKSAYKEFSEKVLPYIGSLSSGQIHGDINENNILVVEKDGKQKVGTVLDWGDTHSTCLIFDLAITIAYVILLEFKNRKVEDIGDDVIKGYQSVMKIQKNELKVLLPSIKARIVMSLVLGNHAYLSNPENEYVLQTTEAGGWNLVKQLNEIDDNYLVNKWIH